MAQNFSLDVNSETFEIEKAVQKMTDYKMLSADRLVQAATFGSDLKVMANFSDYDFGYGVETIKAGSALIIDGDHKTVVAPADQ